MSCKCVCETIEKTKNREEQLWRSDEWDIETNNLEVEHEMNMIVEVAKTTWEDLVKDGRYLGGYLSTE